MPLLTRQSTILGLAITAVLAAAQAPAQTTSAELPEVVVTARQRAERIEDVPATVRAFTDADIQSAGINLQKWLRGFDHVRDGVIGSVNLIKNHPLLPKGIPVHGLLIDPANGKLESVVDGYQHV